MVSHSPCNLHAWHMAGMSGMHNVTVLCSKCNILRGILGHSGVLLRKDDWYWSKIPMRNNSNNDLNMKPREDVPAHSRCSINIYGLNEQMSHKSSLHYGMPK